jgi:cell division protein ZapE
VYLWGPPGRGKSWLVDTWHAALPPGLAYRVHFHDFFRRLQDEVFGRRDEARAVDAAMAALVGRARIVCFDEFHVHDPGDAMLVTRLLRELLDRHTTLVATSNYPPEGLLPNPLFHRLFEPAIRLIEGRLDVVAVTGPVDYRTLASDDAFSRTGFRAGALVSPGDAAQLASYGLTAPPAHAVAELAVNRRTLTARSADDRVLWIDYAHLCEATTSTADYLVLAERNTTWVVDRVPGWDACTRDGRQRLASVVDIAYDRDIRLFLVGPDAPARPPADAEAPPDYFRTASRLAQLRVAATYG